MWEMNTSMVVKDRKIQRYMGQQKAKKDTNHWLHMHPMDRILFSYFQCLQMHITLGIRYHGPECQIDTGNKYV